MSFQDTLASEFNIFKANWNINKEVCENSCWNVAKLVEDSKNEIKLLHVVMLLREEMVSDDENQRKIGISFLSWTLSSLNKESLNINDCETIFEFYNNKLKYDFDDLECVKEIISGLKSIVSMKWYTGKQSLTKLLKFLKEDYNPNQYLASVRYEIFLLVDCIFENFKDAWVSSTAVSNSNVAQLYIETFLNVANGEKDPRNLMLSFNLNQKITSNLSRDIVFKKSQELFDILFCYFPITFKPPKNDPYKISNNDLKLALRRAISQCTFFDDDCFGNLIDKMAASSPSVKNDTLLTMKECIEKYEFQSVLKFWLQLWEALKFDIIRNNGDDKLDEEEFNNYQVCIDVVSALCKKFLLHEQGESFDIVLKKVYKDLENNFINEKNLKQSCGILASIASINKLAFNKVMTYVLPTFFKSEKAEEKLADMNLESMRLLLLNISFFFDSYINVHKITDSHELEDSELLKYKDEILILLSKALTSTSKNEVAIKTLSVVQFAKLVTMKNYLVESEVYMIVQYLTESLLCEEDKNIYFACLEGLKSIALKHESIVKAMTIDKLIGCLNPQEIDGSLSPAYSREKTLRIIIDFTCSKNLFLKECVVGLSHIAKQFHADVDYFFLLSSSIFKLVSSVDGDMDEEIQTSVMKNLYETMFSNQELYENDGILEIVSNIVFLTIAKLDTSKQQHYYDNYVFKAITPVFSSPSQLVVPFTKILSALDLVIDISKVEEHFHEIFGLVSNMDQATSNYVRLGYYQLSSILINKNENLLESSFEDILKKYGDIQILFWLAKGLILQNSKDIKEKMAFLINLLNDERYGSIACRCFSILVIDLPNFEKLKNRNNLRIKILHKQKLFHITVPNLIQNFKFTDNIELKSRYLTSLSYILKSTPIQIKTAFTVELLPLLIQALDVNNSDVRASSLQTIKDILETQSEVLKEHTHTLIEKCLELVDFKNKHNSVKVRLLALEILQILTTYTPINHLQPYKKDIISKLEVSLEDPKRQIRKAGVDARQSYYELGQALI